MQRRHFIKQTALASIALFLQRTFGEAHPFVPGSSSSHVIFYNNKDQEYNRLRQGFNQRINRLPSIIAVCFTTKGVQEAVQHARQLNMPIAIKSGGHCMEGLSVTDGGMQIILRELNQIQWLTPYKIKVGPAVLLHKLYETIIPKGKILPGGSCATVAIGGLSLGGGYGLMSRLFGMTCDSLLEVTMVDGKGNIVNSKTNPELLWACRGGGNGNFGIITEMVFKVHNRPTSMSSYRFRSFNIDTAKGKLILQTWFEQAQKLPNACFSTCLFNGNTAYILLTNVSKSTPAVQQFINKLRAVTDKYTVNLNQPLAVALKNYYGQRQPILFKNASAGLYKSFADIQPIIDNLLAVVFNTKGMIYQVNTLGGAIQTPDFVNKSSFPHRQYPFFSELQTYWEAPATGQTQLQGFAQFQQIIANHGITAQYRNYPDLNFTDYQKAYYNQHLPRLQQIKLQYDPENTIQHAQSIQLKG